MKKRKPQRQRNNAHLRARKVHGSLFSDTFIERSGRRITQALIDGLSMAVSNGKSKFTVTMRKADVRTVLKSMR